MSNDAIVYSAEPFAGLSAGGTPEAFDAAVFRNDTGANARQMAMGQSCCGTTCEAILCVATVDGTVAWNGVTRDWLRYPYAARIGSAIIFQRELGKARGCWVDCTKHAQGDALPDAGDMPEVTGPAHVLTIVRRDGMKLITIEGGQPDKDNPSGKASAITRKTRTMSERDGKLYIDNRVCVGWLRAGALPCVGDE